MPRSKEELAELTEALVRDYGNGMTLKQLELRYDVAASHIGRLLKRAGVALRPNGAQTPIRREGWGGLNGEQRRAYSQRLAGHGPGR